MWTIPESSFVELPLYPGGVGRWNMFEAFHQDS